MKNQFLLLISAFCLTNLTNAGIWFQDFKFPIRDGNKSLTCDNGVLMVQEGSNPARNANQGEKDKLAKEMNDAHNDLEGNTANKAQAENLRQNATKALEAKEQCGLGNGSRSSAPSHDAEGSTKCQKNTKTLMV
jgi:hypothetical protein